MIVSWKWLNDYVSLEMPLDLLTDRLTMTGLNLEGVEQVGDDTAIDLEVTSNRPDCLGHIGVAREIAVLFDQPLTIPTAEPSAISEKTENATSVRIDCEDLCPRYIARVIPGVKIGPSPEWLRQRLETLGIAAINNVVDVTNYVLMEAGQPLHAFDFDKLHEGRIVVRRAESGEKLTAIDQREYELTPEMCVIADADRPVAIGGVMGGLETEIGPETVNVLIETADFSALSIRTTARQLNLHSPSSYRFERGVDAIRLDWASRRCCELILETAGGELLDEPIMAGPGRPDHRKPIVLRSQQIPRILGIDIPEPKAGQILTSLGCEQQTHVDETAYVPPSWRRDLMREADLIEEIARIHGYDRIPDDASIRLQPSTRTRRDRVSDTVRHVLTASGFYEAITLSFVSEAVCDLFTPRGDLPRLRVDHSSRRHENVLRQSLIPSLLTSRRENERRGIFGAKLFEIARVYLRAAPGEPECDVEPEMIAMVGGGGFADLKGLLTALVDSVNHQARMTVQPSSLSRFVPGRGAELLLDGSVWGWMGELDRSVTDRLDLRDAVTVAEVSLAPLIERAELAPRYRELPQFPSVERDLNFVLDEAITWQELESLVRSSAGPLMESVSFGGEYRGQQIGPDRKSYVVTISYRAPDRTLTAEEVDAARTEIVETCQTKLHAALR